MAPRASFILLFLSSLLIQLSLAQSSSYSNGTPTTSTGPSSAKTSESIFSIIASSSPGDGSYGLQPGAVGNDPTTIQGENDAGASGSGNSFVNISTADEIAIIVVAVVVGVFGSKIPSHYPYQGTILTPTTVGSAILYYFAKKRQWELREKLRRSARSIKTALTPRATQTTFNRKDRGVSRVADESPSTSPPPRSAMKKPTVRTNMREVQQANANADQERRGREGRAEKKERTDLEKGMGTKTTVTGLSSFEMDGDSPKTWKQKFFGGRKR